MSDRIPDQIEPDLGWRLWRIPSDDDQFVRSLFVTGKDRKHRFHAWLPGVNKATCLHGVHLAPQADCACGFYACKSLSGALLQANPFIDGQPTEIIGVQLVIGQVYLWGKVLEAEKGYRAEFARIESFCLAPGDPCEETITKLAAAYDVPCTYMDRGHMDTLYALANFASAWRYMAAHQGH